MSDDNEDQQRANIAAWLAEEHAKKQAELVKSDLLPWVSANGLYMPDLARGIQINGQAPWIYQNFSTYFGQNDRKMHCANQMVNTDMKEPGYMVENSFIVRKMQVGEPCQNRWEFRLVAVKILCRRKALAATHSEYGADGSSTEWVWVPYSYTNRCEDGRNPCLWIHYPTGETPAIINYDVDTKTNHKKAVEAAMDAKELIDFMICVIDSDGDGNVAVQHVFSKALVVNAWRETDDGEKKVAMYQIKVCPEKYTHAA